MVGFTPVEEVEEILVVPRDGVVKEVRVFFREELVEEQSVDTVLMEDLVVAEVLVLQLRREEVVVVEGTLVEAVGVDMKTPVGEGEDLTTTEQIRKMTVVLKQPAMDV